MVEKGQYAKRTDWHVKIGKKTWKFFVIISSIGMEFNHNGDWVYWLWWWKRSWESEHLPYVSTSFQGLFKSLKEIDDMWDEYWKAEKQPPSNNEVDIVI